MIEMHNVYRYRFAGGAPQILLNDVSVRFESGERIGILATGASGKTTLLRLLSGVERPDRGYIRTRGSVSFPIGTSAGFHPDLPCTENVRILARLLRRNVGETADYCESFADIGHAFTRPFKELAPTQRARLAFALSMSVEFDTYLSDGVTSAGDHGFRDKCEVALRDRLERSGIILLSRHTHVLDRFCTRIFALHEARLIPCGSAEEARDVLDLAHHYGDAVWNAEDRNGPH